MALAIPDLDNFNPEDKLSKELEAFILIKIKKYTAATDTLL